MKNWLKKLQGSKKFKIVKVTNTEYIKVDEEGNVYKNSRENEVTEIKKDTSHEMPY